MGIFNRLFGSSKDTFIAPPRDVHNNVQPKHDTKAIPSNKGGHAFRFVNEESTPADAYGMKIVVLAIEVSSKQIEEMFGDNEAILKMNISEHTTVARAHIIALQIAVYYVLADRLCSSNRIVMENVVKGIAHAMGIVFDGATNGSDMAQFLHTQFQKYAASLVAELNTPPSSDNPFDTGATADLVAEYIRKDCQKDLLTDNPVDELRFKLLAANTGIRLLLVLLSKKIVTYVG